MNDIDISPETLQNFCRCCLKKLKKLKCNIQSLGLEMRHWLNDATIEYPLETDAYPNSICKPCRTKLQDFLDFRQMCARSRKTVSDILEKQSESKETIYKKEDMLEESLVDQHLLTTEVGDLQDPVCTVKNEPFNDSDIKEPMLVSLNPADIINESANASITSSFLENIARHGIFDKSSDDNECDILDESSDNSNHGILDKSSDENESDVLDESSDENESDGSKYNPESGSDSNEDDGRRKKKKVSLKKANKSTEPKQKQYQNKFRCDKCYQYTLSQQILDIHKRRHNGLKPYQCPHCNLDFDKLKEILAHLKELHGENGLNIICEIEDCGMKFTSTASYKEHYRSNHAVKEPHENGDKPVNRVKRDKPVKPNKTKKINQHVCEECGKIFIKSNIFKEHLYRHGPKSLYPFQCTECDKAFVKLRTFNEHKMRHAGIKNFECTHCGVKKTTKKELRAHMNSHTREKKYPCPHCEKIFYRTTNLRIHVDVIHKGIRRYACSYCDLTFGKGDNLKNHELLHTGLKPHDCKECGKQFTQKVSLRLHMKTHNK